MQQSNKQPQQAEEWWSASTSNKPTADAWYGASFNYLAAGRNHPFEPHIHQNDEVDQVLWRRLTQVLVAFLLLATVLTWLA